FLLGVKPRMSDHSHIAIARALHRPAKSASELKRQDYVSAAHILENKIRKFAPANLAFLGKAEYAAVSLDHRVPRTWQEQLRRDDFVYGQ
ncbi:hypothetical protein ACC680_36910, partial [Rhizobium ruizarguesonis]